MARGESALSTDVSFYCRPYLLQISLPGVLCTDDDDDGMQTTGGGTGSGSSARYNPDLDFGTLFITLRKRNKGECLPDLELISNLLRPAYRPLRHQSGGAGIEVISSSSATTNANASSAAVAAKEGGVVVESRNEEADLVDEEELAWNFDRTVTFGNGNTTTPIVVYGFNGRHSCIFSDLRDELSDIIELPLPDETPVEFRTAKREEQEEQDFDPERYIGDLFDGDEDYILKEALAVELPLFTVGLRMKGGEYFTDEERHQLAATSPSPVMGSRGLRLKSGSASERAAMNGLADVLCGFAYDFRTTDGEKNVESSWTCTILSSTLSWLEPWGLLCSGCEAEAMTDPSKIDGPKAVIRSFTRRVLCYPYLRRWDLALQCANDSLNAIKAGKRAILRALLYVYSAIERSESKYLLNKLFITDFIFWVQSSDLMENCLITYANQMKTVIEGLTKDDIDLNLNEYEAMAENSRHSNTSSSNASYSSGSSSSVCSSSCASDINEEEEETSSTEDEEDLGGGEFNYGRDESAILSLPSSRVLITELP